MAEQKSEQTPTQSSTQGSSPRRHHDRHKLVRLGIAVVIGTVVALLVPVPKDSGSIGSILVGFIVSALAFTLPLIVRIMRATPAETKDYVEGLDPGRSITDLVVLAGALASLAGVGMMLLAKGTSDSAKAVEALITLGAVLSGWLLIHTMYGLRYARHWHNAEEDCIDYHMDEQPAYSDFLYTAFAVGVSFAISDTDLKTTRVRRIALGHAWLSYLFGTVAVAATINLIAGLAG
ncbi:MAG: DUF1345 domain-containing protein [Dermatophilaceae bacterium]